MGIDDHIKECLAPFYEEINQIDNKCDEYEKAMELKFRQKEYGEYFFSGEEGLRNKIKITLLWVDQEKQTVDVLLHQDQEEMTFRDVPLGYVVTISKVNVQPLQLTEEDYNGEKHNFAKVCVFKTGTQGTNEDESEDGTVIEDIEDIGGDDLEDNSKEREEETNEESDDAADNNWQQGDNQKEINENQGDQREQQEELGPEPTLPQKQQKKKPALIRFLKWITSFI